MNKEQKIEEMKKVMCEEYGKECDFCPCSDCANEMIAERLYNAGYRKANYVRKETAKEILDMICDMGIDKVILECCKIYDVNGVSIAKQICEKYGVEIKNE